ncbi:lysylphosphatidylglycerol synthase transmembrane domain-containing protein [Actinoallomurus acaciae]|uniref:YbhN family protein n=1 Tax=Actinoallomurus acaciae TaxID=502577 RepID=A0ABV5YV66_9ACTN
MDSGRRRRLMWAGRVVMAGTVVVCLVVFRDDLPDPEAMWRVTLHAGPGWLACAVVAQVASMSMFARVQRRLLRAGGVRMSLPRALRMTYAGNALSTTLPAGPAISVAFNFRQYRRAGAAPRLATSVVMLGGVIMTSAYAAVGVAALVAAPSSRALAVAGLVLLAAGIGLCALVAWRHGASLARLARRLARPVLRHRLAAPYAERLRESGAGLRLRPADWAMLTFASLFNWVFDILSLTAAGRAVGVHTALYSITLAYFAAQAAGTLVPLLPGGLGAMEGSLAASLVAFGALSAPAGAAVALYRLVSFWGVVGVGWLAWLAVKAAEKDDALPPALPARDALDTA